MMDAHTELRREVQMALAIIRQHPHATDAELDTFIQEALHLRTTPMARMWRILAQDIHSQSPEQHNEQEAQG
jgi:hypothetical protein